MAPGSSVELSYDGDAGEAFRYSFVVSDTPSPDLDQVVVSTSAGDTINVGTSVFFHDKVLFDQGRAVIDVRPC